MKNTIGRTLFWFKNADGYVKILNEGYFAFGTLLNRLMNEKYEGRKIKFINICLAPEEYYRKFACPVNHLHYHSGHLNFDGLIDFNEFNRLSKSGQVSFVWNKGYEYLKSSALMLKNNNLLEACEYAYHKGLEIGLNPDYKMVEADVVLYGVPVNASVWVNFKNDGMDSKFSLEKDGKVIFEKEIDATINGIEFFLEMYKKIEVKNNGFLIKGHYGVDYLPLLIPIDKELLEG